jgi:putative hydrolase of the HAD superfamily
MNSIRNIIFDLGGVIMNIDFNRTFTAFEVIGLRHAEEKFQDPDINRLCMDFETGLYCSMEMRRKFREITGFKCNDEQFDKAWNALLIDYPPERIARIREVAGKYKTFLLSNTNPIHARHFNGELKRHFGIESLDHLFDKAWYSHNLGYRKPDERIFEKVMKISRLRPEETLFLDDSALNVKAAQSVGMQAVQITEDFTVIDALRKY